MYKENSIDNWVLGGTVFLLIFTVGCYLWFQNEMSYLQPDDDHHMEMQHLDNSLESEHTETQRSELIPNHQPTALKKNSSDSDSSPIITSDTNSIQQKNIETSKTNRINTITFKLLPTS